MLRVLFVAVLFAVFGCAPQTRNRGSEPEPLYFSVELTEGGKRVGAPKLIGFSGKRVIAERRQPGAAESDYRLVLEPSATGAGYQLGVKVKLPSGERSAELGLLHGEERKVQLGKGAELKVMLMRVNSEEFRQLILVQGPADRGQI